MQGISVKMREKAFEWDRDITEARRTLNWDRQISLAINPEEEERIRNRRQGQIHSNSAPCTMCGVECVYIMLPQQRIETSHD
jgi:phosphomethylpyrimidine synthase